MRTAARPLPGEPDLPFLVAVAAILAGKEEELVSSALAEVRFEVDPVARRLGELVRLSYKPAAPTVPASGGSESGARKLPDERGIFEKLDAVLATMRTATPLQFEADLCAAALRGVLGDPADVGLALLAAHLQQRCGRLALARAARGLALFLEPDLVLKGSIESLGGDNLPSRPPGARRWPSIPCATGPCAACCARWRPPWLRYPVRGALPSKGRRSSPRPRLSSASCATN